MPLENFTSRPTDKPIERIRDASARLRREEQLKRTTAVLEAIQEASLDGILIVDEKGRILTYNSRFARMWGIPEDVLATRSDEEALKSAACIVADPEGFLERVQALYCDRQATSRDEIVLNDRRVFDRYSAPITGANGAYYGRAWYFRDVTPLKQAEQALEEKTCELERSGAELQQFAMAASHDLREPLRKISAFGELLRKRSGDKLDARGRDFLGRMQSAAARMNTLIEDLFQFSRVYGDMRPLEPVDLGQATREVAASLASALSAAEGSIVIGNLPVVLARPLQMRQLLHNLLSNSIKFRRPGIPLRATVSSRPAADGFFLLRIEDNGIGFAQEYAEKIFQPFLRLHARQEYEGAGLGLAICRRIATRHGGRICGQGVVGSGATFTVTLPIGRRP